MEATAGAGLFLTYKVVLVLTLVPWQDEALRFPVCASHCERGWS